MKIFPSLISADLLNLETVIKQLDPYCNGLHLDVMDDHFVPNLTWGPAFINQIIYKTRLPIQLHLMVDEPEKWIKRVNLRSKDILIFHYEAISDHKRISSFIELLKIWGVQIGIAINPKTKINKIFDYLDSLDYILIMSVEPGFSGQKFIPEVLDKVKDLVNIRREMNLKFQIGMDGGINKKNIKIILNKGVDQIAVATAIFSGSNFVQNLKDLSNI